MIGMLYRRYLRGEISDEEQAYRIGRDICVLVGPLVFVQLQVVSVSWEGMVRERRWGEFVPYPGLCCCWKPTFMTLSETAE